MPLWVYLAAGALVVLGCYVLIFCLGMAAAQADAAIEKALRDERERERLDS